MLDAQSAHAAAGVPSSTAGRDPAKWVPGRKRGLVVDVLGLVIAIAILSANTHDNTAGIALLDQVAEHTGGTVGKVLVDQGFKNQIVDHGTRLGADVETVARNPQGKGVRLAAEALEGRTDLRDLDIAPAPGPRSRTPAGLLGLPRPLGDAPRHGPPPHRREHSHPARPTGRGRMIQPLLDALDIQENAARAPADGLRTRIAGLRDRLRETETHREHLAITRKTATVLADRLPTQPASPNPPEHPDHPRQAETPGQSRRPRRSRHGRLRREATATATTSTPDTTLIEKRTSLHEPSTYNWSPLPAGRGGCIPPPSLMSCSQVRPS